jgi:DNA-binding HxlR family transcriptional regulator
MKLSECPVRTTADVIDGKWKPMIVNALKAKPLRLGQLLRALPEATRKVATAQLRELERRGHRLPNRLRESMGTSRIFLNRIRQDAGAGVDVDG